MRKCKDYSWKEQVHWKLHGTKNRPKHWEDYKGSEERIAKLTAEGFFDD